MKPYSFSQTWNNDLLRNTLKCGPFWHWKSSHFVFLFTFLFTKFSIFIKRKHIHMNNSFHLTALSFPYPWPCPWAPLPSLLTLDISRVQVLVWKLWSLNKECPLCLDHHFQSQMCWMKWSFLYFLAMCVPINCKPKVPTIGAILLTEPPDRPALPSHANGGLLGETGKPASTVTVSKPGLCPWEPQALCLDTGPPRTVNQLPLPQVPPWLPM